MGHQPETSRFLNVFERLLALPIVVENDYVRIGDPNKPESAVILDKEEFFLFQCTVAAVERFCKAVERFVNTGTIENADVRARMELNKSAYAAIVACSKLPPLTATNDARKLPPRIGIPEALRTLTNGVNSGHSQFALASAIRGSCKDALPALTAFLAAHPLPQNPGIRKSGGRRSSPPPSPLRPVSLS